MKRSATHRTCDDEEWIEGRSKEIRRNNQDGATNRNVSSADIYRVSEVSFLISLNLSEMWERLYRLTCKNVKWIWTYEHKDAFEKINNAFFKALVLKHFSESDLIEGQKDASKDGFGFLLMQNSKPVESESQGAPPIRERKYYQIEK